MHIFPLVWLSRTLATLSRTHLKSGFFRHLTTTLRFSVYGIIWYKKLSRSNTHDYINVDHFSWFFVIPFSS
jgi:hypothetical protein